MKVHYTLSQSLIPLQTETNIDLIVSFGTSQTNNNPSRRPLNISLVLDRSGSMAGYPLSYAIQAAQKLVEYLTPDDILSVVIYDDVPEIILPPQPVINRASIKQQLRKISARGCTNLSGGWLMGCDQVKTHVSSQQLNRVLLLTDGLANVGEKRPNILTKTAEEKAKQGIITTTLGFGSSFNEDLLISMANAGGGNFYFIQSPDEAADVFAIEMESLVSVAAQNLTVTLKEENNTKVVDILNSYRQDKKDSNLSLFLGDVYQFEPKPLAISLSIPPQFQPGNYDILTLACRYETVINDSLQQCQEEVRISIKVGDQEESQNIATDPQILGKTSQLRIAKIKDNAIALADQGNYQEAAENLRKFADNLKQKALAEFFEIAEEISQLEYYAETLENRRYSQGIRKEMRDQSYQSLSRNRSDLKLRGVTSGSAEQLEAISDAKEGVIVKCERIEGKLRIRVISEGYDQTLNVQFPRSIRAEGVNYVVENIVLSANGTFYRTSGKIQRLVKPGEEKKASQTTAKNQDLKAVKSSLTLADLEETDTVGNGILIQCVKDGKKLRARVVSDGYNPDYNIRFPRNIRQEGILFLVDGIKETSQGGSYIALGKVRRFIQ
ncbi:VWA domain-containing protein [Crocosphaera sp. UHCC 0190]|uniref:vWA domain-containing protein n=1 Tax=Crocosphaera sp. UHCC 0190 TaxID=3110246 RepID=UPI002B219245|nr:VWA domain-containing protein [Crocosphaera sp. UHCC 0190]MEA5510959.1 VWA domain-containing protein [Crocosphaera sp. UHCC 0190]